MKLKGRKVRKLAVSGVSVLEKEILRPGRYVDQDGQELFLTTESIRAYVNGTQELISQSFRVNAFPDHETSNSKDRQGRWIKVWQDDRGCARGWFLPASQRAEKLALENDSSAVLVDDFDLGSFKVKAAMPRIDIVPQGAVIGTESFKPVGLKLAANQRAGRVRALACKKEKTMKSRLAALLSLAMGGDMVDEEQPILDVLKDHLMSSRGLQTPDMEFGDDDLAGALKELLSGSSEAAAAAPDGEEAPVDETDPMADGGDEMLEDLAEELEDEEEPLEAAAPGAKLSARNNKTEGRLDAAAASLEEELRELQRDQLSKVLGSARKLSAKTSPIERKVFDEARELYEDLRPVKGHKLALSTVRKYLLGYVHAAEQRHLTKGAKVERKLAAGTPKKAAEPEPVGDNNPLLATRGGPARNGTAR